jgi:hypothetical protein
MPLFPTFITAGPETGDTLERLMAKLLSSANRSTVRGTALAAATRSATTAATQFDGTGYKGLIAYLNLYTASGTGGLLVVLQYLDPVSGSWMNGPFAPSTAKTTTGTFCVMFGEGIAAGTGGTINTAQSADRGAMLGQQVRLMVSHGDATNYGYSLGYELIPK